MTVDGRRWSGRRKSQLLSLPTSPPPLPHISGQAYAKAHGSYQSISGGWVAEALLDLTGAPTEVAAPRLLRA